MTTHTTRRAFLGAATTILGGALVGVGAACRRSADVARQATDGTTGIGARSPSADAIGLQLYTVRTLMERDFEGTLAAVAGIGYREVEFAGYFGREPARLRATLDDLRLAAPSAHRPIEQFRTGLSPMLDEAEALGHRYLTCPWLAEGERTLDGYRRLAGEFNQWGAACRDRGMRFAYHNHEFEFAPMGGTVPFDLLLAETDPALVAYELDLFWIIRAGRDPLEYFDRHKGRFPMWHVKDMRGIGSTHEMTAVGAGEIDFAGIFARAGDSGLEHFFVEHDQPADPLASVRNSYDHLRNLLA
ncbi:MAG TPA: sugar phosphate isomerase/epimerase [Gemmatimonadaceae bacterium]|nr:sugar phosphate isomerase/epimerase [Gemmatimonadaceae bacterium]